MAVKERSRRLANLPSLEMSRQEVHEGEAYAEAQINESLRSSARFDLKKLNFRLITIQEAT
ncbi:hypothetical protein PMIT1306_00987 [Prochlorococcus sp. MIT 1306]|nr:hypothetical protein PMIT1306_00987 [Prochlorococcus sp. MIT 1306]